MNTSDIAVAPSPVERADQVLTRDALRFVAALHEEFAQRRYELLELRQARRAAIHDGGTLDFNPATAQIRAAEWAVAPAPDDLADRRVEITGPAEPKMAINALNSGARVWLVRRP